MTIDGTVPSGPKPIASADPSIQIASPLGQPAGNGSIGTSGAGSRTDGGAGGSAATSGETGAVVVVTVVRSLAAGVVGRTASTALGVVALVEDHWSGTVTTLESLVAVVDMVPSGGVVLGPAGRRCRRDARAT
jgi:hypothetical protein